MLCLCYAAAVVVAVASNLDVIDTVALVCSLNKINLVTPSPSPVAPHPPSICCWSSSSAAAPDLVGRGVDLSALPVDLFPY
jgi:hypothetical protein